MRRSFFSSGSSPRVESSPDDSNRRRSFAFLKQSSKSSTTPTSMRRTREHARQIAQQLSTAPPENDFLSPTIPTKSQSAHRNQERQKSTTPKSSAFDLNPLIIPAAEGPKKLDLFVQRTKNNNDKNKRRPPKHTSQSVTSQETNSTKNSRSVRSMPTFPSNSTMLPANVHRSRNAIPSSPEPRPPSPSIMSASPVASTAAASASLWFDSQTSLGSTRSWGSIGSGGSLTGTPTRCQRTISNRASSPATSVNVFTEGIDHGFSFDAFGLDANLVDQEVTAAMNDLAGEWGEEFPLQSFDSPTASRSPSPPVLDSEDGFEDGFRLTGINRLPLHSRQSPTGSHRSSLRSGSGGRKEFGSASSFHSDDDGFGAVISRESPISFTGQPPTQHNFSDDSWAPFDTSGFGDFSFGDPSFGDQTTLMYARSEPGLVSAVQFPKISSPEKYRDVVQSHDDVNQYFSQTLRKTESEKFNADSDKFNSTVGVAWRNNEQYDLEATSQQVWTKPKPSIDTTIRYLDSKIIDDSFAEWNGRSPVNRLELWGEDITPEEPDMILSPDSKPQDEPQDRVFVSQPSEQKYDNYNYGFDGSGLSGLSQIENGDIHKQSARIEEPIYKAGSQTQIANKMSHFVETDETESDDDQSCDDPPEKPTAVIYEKQSQSTPINQTDQRVRINGAVALKTVENRGRHEPPARASECIQQRTSLESLKARLKATKLDQPKSYAMSDVGLRTNHGEFSAVMNRMKNGNGESLVSAMDFKHQGVSQLASKFDAVRTTSPIEMESKMQDQDGKKERKPSDRYEEVPNSVAKPNSIQYDIAKEKSEISYERNLIEQMNGISKPTYQFDKGINNVSTQAETLRNHVSTLTTSEKRTEQDKPYSLNQHEIAAQQPFANTAILKTEASLETKTKLTMDQMEIPKKKLTYREQRELELQKVREEKERQAAAENSKAPPNRDVATLIRRRIAANKQSTANKSENAARIENYGNVANRLKRVSIESKITQFRVPIREENPPEFVEKVLKKVPEHETSQASITERKMENDHESEDDVQTDRTWDKNLSIPYNLSLDQASSENITKDMAREISPPKSHVVQAETIAVRHAPSPMAAIHEALLRKVSPIEESSTSIESKKSVPIDTKGDSIVDSSVDTKTQLNAFFANRLAGGTPIDIKSKKEDEAALLQSKAKKNPLGFPVSDISEVKVENSAQDSRESPMVQNDGRPALKNDPKYDRYFRMLKVGMPMDVVKHAMTQDGVDPSVMDGDHNKPAGFGSGVPLNQDPRFTKYFKMLSIGLPMGAVKNAMERDGLDASIMDRDHNLPANVDKGDNKVNEEKKVKDTHRRTRLHWDTVRKIKSDSLWAKIDQDEDVEGIQIDEEEFQELFQAELAPESKSRNVIATKKGAAVRVIDSKRANNGGIILARLKMTHDEMADAVDRIDQHAMSPEQMQNIIEYLPTAEERKSLEAYMLSGGIDAAEKFDGLCECEKFMVAMMTVKHAKRKVRALLFRLQFQSCLDSLESDVIIVAKACDELINSVRLRKLLGIVLNIGNRLNTAGVSGKGKAGAFSLESLLKLNHAKAFDKKTTFLHYIVLVIQRNNELLLRVKDDLPTVIKARRVYWDQLEQDLEEVENQLENVRKVSLHQAKLITRFRLRKTKKEKDADDDEDSLSDSSLTLEEEVELLRASEIGVFTLGAIKKVSALRDKVDSTKANFVRLREYFGEDEKQDMQPHDVFNIISTFCRDFDKAKEEVASNTKKKLREERINKQNGSNPKLTGVSEQQVNKNYAGDKSPSQPAPSDSKVRVSSHQPNMHKLITSTPNHASQNVHDPTKKVPSAQTQVSAKNGLLNNIPQKKDWNSPRSELSEKERFQSSLKHQSIATPLEDGPHKGHNGASTPRMSPTSLRQKAMQHRVRGGSNNHYGSDSSATSATTSLSTLASTDAQVMPMNASYAALGQSAMNSNTNQASPLSTIRQKRREEIRRQMLRRSVVTQWPEDTHANS